MIKMFDRLTAEMVVACARSKQKKSRGHVRPKMVMKLHNQYGSRYDVDDELVPDMLIRKHKTFIMRWKPSISNFKIADFEASMECFLDRDFYYDWSVWDHEQVRIGDRFFMIKEDGGTCGVVMEGVIIGLPYIDEDWRGEGREVHYVRMLPNCMVHPVRSESMLTLDELAERIPSFNWYEGHSGELLSDVQAMQLDALWDNHLEKLQSRV